MLASGAARLEVRIELSAGVTVRDWVRLGVSVG